VSAVIRVRDACKEYPASAGRRSIKEMLVHPRRWLRMRSETETVLEGVSFEIEKGDCVGVIGRNGAGKSTLLALILGVAFPTSGKVEVDGKCTPLLELGAGFHPDLTGLENIMLNGVLMGLPRRAVEQRLEQIIEFSELGEAVHKPIRTYSDGMQIRLAFAVAVHTDPEILLIDEVLAVGDAEFQVKSQQSIAALMKSGVTTLLVSHDLDEVEALCDRVLWIDEGRIRLDGEPSAVLTSYRQECALGSQPSASASPDASAEDASGQL
jgi:lipopolysaccharide transport system ATP-binding protein